MFARISKRTTSVLKTALVFVLSVPGLQAAMITLNPLSGAVSGSQGQKVGWGFTLTNSTDWLVVTNSGFCSGTGHTAADLGTAACTTAYAAIGSYTDYIAATFSSLNLIIGTPNPPDANGGPACTVSTTTSCDMASLAQAFDGMGMGVGQFVINPSAASSAMVSGQLLVTYDLFSRSPNNPNFNPDTDLVSTDNLFAPLASVTVTASVPEPGTLLFMGPALAAFGLLRFRRRARLS